MIIWYTLIYSIYIICIFSFILPTHTHNIVYMNIHSTTSKNVAYPYPILSHFFRSIWTQFLKCSYCMVSSRSPTSANQLPPKGGFVFRGFVYLPTKGNHHWFTSCFNEVFPTIPNLEVTPARHRPVTKPEGKSSDATVGCVDVPTLTTFDVEDSRVNGSAHYRHWWCLGAQDEKGYTWTRWRGTNWIGNGAIKQRV